MVSGVWRVSRADSRPGIRARVVSATGVHPNTATYSAPDNHFTAGPYGGV